MYCSVPCNQRAFHRRNGDKRRAAQAEYRARRKDARRQYDKEYRERTSEYQEKRRKSYYLENRERFYQSNHRRRSLLRGNDAKTVTKRDWYRICLAYDFSCAYCGSKESLTREHVIPLSRGGRHAIGNLVPACDECNKSKKAQLLSEWRLRKQKG